MYMFLIRKPFEFTNGVDGRVGELDVFLSCWLDNFLCAATLDKLVLL